MKWFIPMILYVLLLLISCKNNGTKNHSKIDSTAATQKTISVAGNFSSQQTIKFDAEKITDFFTKYPEFISLKNEIDSFYHSRQYAYAWFDHKGMVEQTANLYNHIQNISSEGLASASPYKNEFVAMMSDDHSDSVNVDTEIMLTAQYFVFAKEVWTGLSEKETQQLNWYVPKKKNTLFFAARFID